MKAKLFSTLAALAAILFASVLYGAREIHATDRADVSALISDAVNVSFRASQKISLSPAWYKQNGHTNGLLAVATAIEDTPTYTTAELVRLLETMRAGMLWWVYYYAQTPTETAYLDGYADGVGQGLKLVKLALETVAQESSTDTAPATTVTPAAITLSYTTLVTLAQVNEEQAVVYEARGDRAILVAQLYTMWFGYSKGVHSAFTSANLLHQTAEAFRGRASVFREYIKIIEDKAAKDQMPARVP